MMGGVENKSSTMISNLLKNVDQYESGVAGVSVVKDTPTSGGGGSSPIADSAKK